MVTDTIVPTAHTDYPSVTRRTISWRAILAGVSLVLVVQILLSMLGTGIGMSTIDLQQTGESPSVQAFSIGAGLWWVVSFFLSLAIGGAVSAHFSGYTTRWDAILQGLVTWAVATLLGVYLVTSALGSLISGAGSVVSGVMHTVGMGAVAAAPALSKHADVPVDAGSLNWNAIQNQVEAALLPAKAPANGQPGDVASNVKNYFQQGEAASPEDRQAVVSLIARNSNLSNEEAEQKLTQLETNYKAAAAKLEQTKAEAKAKAKVAADETAKVVAHLSLWGFLAFVLSAIAAALGGIAGSNCRRNEVLGDVRHRL